jgi:hypothetical protein
MWKNEQRELWKAVRRAADRKPGRCRHVQIPELFSLEMCDEAVMDSSRPQKSRSSHVAEQSRMYLAVFLFLFFCFVCDLSSCFRFVCLRGRGGLGHLAGHPEVEGTRALPYSRRVNVV